MILIGSRALALRAPSCLARRPVDFDFVCTRDEANAWVSANRAKINITKEYELPGPKMIVEGDTNIEFELIAPGSSNELLVDLVNADPDTIDAGSFGKIPTLDLLFAIKQSHRYRKFQYDDRLFWKTAIDLAAMKSVGAKVRDEHQAFFKLREQESYAAQKHPKLNVSKEAFFTDIFKYDHDSIHVAMKHLDRPAYHYYGKDNEPVLSDKAKFFAVSEDIRFYGAIEETSVLALERSIIAHPGVWSHEKAWRFACAKVASTITSSWFRQWVYEHLFDLLKRYPADYVAKFETALAAGIVKPFNQEGAIQ
jgi:hypothetical protein